MNVKFALLPSIVAAMLALPVAAYASASACTTVAGNLAQNCGFQTGDFTGWTLSGNDVVYAKGVPSNDDNLNGVDPGTDPDGIAPHSGSTQAYFGDSRTDPATLTQTISTVAGDTYQVLFYVAQDTPVVAPDGNFMDASFGSGILDMTNIAVNPNGYTEYSFLGTATSSSSTLSLVFGNDQGYFLLDDVSVTVPEPSTPVLVGTAALLLLVLRSRSRRS